MLEEELDAAAVAVEDIEPLEFESAFGASRLGEHTQVIIAARAEHIERDLVPKRLIAGQQLGRSRRLGTHGLNCHEAKLVLTAGHVYVGW
jgi:hypothetical protein